MKKDYAIQTQKETLGVSRSSLHFYAQRTRQWRARVALATLFVVLLFWTYLIFLSPLFVIQSITIQGVEKLNPSILYTKVQTYLASKKYFLLPKNNFFIFDAHDFKKYFIADMQIASVETKKNLRSRSLSITIVERVPSYIAVFPDTAFAIDKEGIAITALALPPPALLPMIIHTQNRNVKIGEHAIDATRMTPLRIFLENLARTYPFESVTMDAPSPNTAIITTKEGWAIYVHLTDDGQAQYERLKVLFSAKIKPERRKTLQYVDLRFGERVYYK